MSPMPCCRLSSARRWAREASRAIATAEGLLGLAHVAFGAAERVGHRHAVLVELLHEVAELAAQAFLVAALLVAPLAVAAGPDPGR